MDAFQRATGSTAGDLAWLTGLCLLAIGAYAACLPTVGLPAQLVLLCLFELALGAALWSWSDGALRPALGYAMRLQAQSAAQVIAAVYLAPLPALAMLAALQATQPDKAIDSWLSLERLLPYQAMLASAVAVTIVAVTGFRLHGLRSKGMSFATLASGAHEHYELSVPVGAGKTLQHLGNCLRPLGQRGGPALQRFGYGRLPTVVLLDVAGGAAYELHWAWCPSKVRITVSELANGQSRLHVACLLRGGLWRATLFVNPFDALAQIDYLRREVVDVLASELALSDALARQHALRLSAVEMQLRVMQAQIEPHFLFNTLANVRQLYRDDVAAGETMLDHLIRYLRSAIEELRSDASSVAQELDLVLHYLAIMKIRMGNRLSYKVVQPDALAALAFPPAMLISLVENALMHGIADRPDGRLTVSAARDGDTLRLTVEDNGAGFSSIQGSGVGLSNIRQRLEALYGNRAWLEVGAVQGGGFVASITVPITENP